MNEPILTCENLTVSYYDKTVLSQLSFCLKPGRVLGVIGESGSGKTTLLRAIAGILGKGSQIEEGTIRFRTLNQQVELIKLSPKERRQLAGAQIGMIFQRSGSVFCPIKTIESQFYECLRAHDKIKRDECKNKALDLLEKMNFDNGESVLKSYIWELSGGMQQRVGIVAAMLTDPSLLLADEPTSALDTISQKLLIKEMEKLKYEFHRSMILVTHHVGVARALSDDLIVLNRGKVVEQGEASRVLESPQNDYTKRLLAAVPRFLDFS